MQLCQIGSSRATYNLYRKLANLGLRIEWNEISQSMQTGQGVGEGERGRSKNKQRESLITAPTDTNGEC